MRPTSRPGVQAAPTRGQQEAVTRATFPGLVTQAHSSVPKPWISSTQGTEAATPPTHSSPRHAPRLSPPWGGSRLFLVHYGAPGASPPLHRGGARTSCQLSPEPWVKIPSRARLAFPGGKHRPSAQPCPSLPAQQGDTRQGRHRIQLASASLVLYDHTDEGRHPAPLPLGSKCFPLELTDAATGPLPVPCPLLRGPSLHPRLGNSS